MSPKELGGVSVAGSTDRMRVTCPDRRGTLEVQLAWGLLTIMPTTKIFGLRTSPR